MKPKLLQSVINRIAGFFGIHPEVGNLISAGFRLSNPSKAAFPTENLPFASHVIASGVWNYCFFQFYRNFAGPYWVEKQYNPEDPAFIPRASSPLNINITHRTWMGFRSPRGDHFSLIDPAGALAPVAGYYSIEVAIEENGSVLLPTREQVKVKQRLYRDMPVPITLFKSDLARITQVSAGASDEPDIVISSLVYEIKENHSVKIILGIRPFNTEGAAPIQKIKVTHEEDGSSIIHINEIPEIILFQHPDQVKLSNLNGGDAYFISNESNSVECSYGIATGSIVFNASGKGSICFAARTYDRKTLPFEPNRRGHDIRKSRILRRHRKDPLLMEMENYREVLINETLEQKKRKGSMKKEDLFRVIEIEKRNNIEPDEIIQRGNPASIVQKEVLKSAEMWETLTDSMARFKSAKPGWNRAAAIMTRYVLSLQTADTLTPGVYTYRQFWFRDAAYMLHAMIRWNMPEQAKKVILTFPKHQARNGFFKSHEGEWDSNGQAIWSILDYVEHTGDTSILNELYPSIMKGAQWIESKRKTGYKKKLMPAGFSAEHLGPADYYFWDNIWSIAGLAAAVKAATLTGKTEDAKKISRELESFQSDLLEASASMRNQLNLLTAGPQRPIDPGMIGSILPIYPLDLHIFPAEQIENTVRTIRKNFFLKNLFFHPIIHSGYNIYLTLQMAHCLFRMGDISDSRRILKSVLSVRSELWTYPEAIHPGTGGGAMGDGFHGWAFSELLNLLREYVISRENDTIHIFRGLKKRELLNAPLEFGPFPLEGVAFRISGELYKSEGNLKIECSGIKTTLIKELIIHLPESLDKLKLQIQAENCNVKKSGGSLVLTEPGDSIHLSFHR